MAPSVTDPVVISATRLTVVGGEKGSEGCERKYFGQYPLGIKQEETEALRRGSALHLLAEIFQQSDGHVELPESEVGTIFRSGAHLLSTCGPLLVEWAHSGQFPDGTEWIAYLDGHSPDGGHTVTVVVQDLKTTSRPDTALNTDKDSPNYLAKNIQSMFYAWIILCCPHWYAPPLEDGHFGPMHWRWWDPVVQRAKNVRLRWLYFLTSGKPRAWDVSVFVTPEQAQAFYEDTIASLVVKILAIHRWHQQNPGAKLDELDRNSSACKGRQIWCGPGEHGYCDLQQLGTPIADLVQLRVRPKLSPQQRLAALKKPGAPPAEPTTPTKEHQNMPTPAELAAERLAALKAKNKPAVTGVAAPAPAPEAPAASPPSESPCAPGATAPVTGAEEETSAPAASAPTSPNGTTEAPKKTRQRRAPAAPPVNPVTGTTAGINPPEVTEALANLPPTLQEPAAAPATFQGTLGDVPLEVLLREVVRRVMGVSK